MISRLMLCLVVLLADGCHSDRDTPIDQSPGTAGVELPAGLAGDDNIRPDTGRQAAVAPVPAGRIACDSAMRRKPSYSPVTHPPRILYPDELVKSIREAYPPDLLERGIEGSTSVWFLVTDDGEVGKAIMARSSGHLSMDRAALRVAGEYRFTPALFGTEPVCTWIQIPIPFRLKLGQ